MPSVDRFHETEQARARSRAREKGRQSRDPERWHGGRWHGQPLPEPPARRFRLRRTIARAFTIEGITAPEFKVFTWLTIRIHKARHGVYLAHRTIAEGTATDQSKLPARLKRLENAGLLRVHRLAGRPHLFDVVVPEGAEIADVPEEGRAA